MLVTCDGSKYMFLKHFLIIGQDIRLFSTKKLHQILLLNHLI